MCTARRILFCAAAVLLACILTVSGTVPFLPLSYTFPGAIRAQAEETNYDSAYYILPESSDRLLDASELYGMDAATLRLARNEIYARHGRIFASEDLNAYFRTKSWYNGTIPAASFDESVISRIERVNLKLITDVEEGRVIPPAPSQGNGIGKVLPGMNTETVEGTNPSVPAVSEAAPFAPDYSIETLSDSCMQEYGGKTWVSPTGYWLGTAPKAWADYAAAKGYAFVPEQVSDRQFIIKEDTIYYLDAVEAGTDGSHQGGFALRTVSLDGSLDQILMPPIFDPDQYRLPHFLFSGDTLYFTTCSEYFNSGYESPRTFAIYPGNDYADWVVDGELAGAAYGYLYLLDSGNLIRVNTGNTKDICTMAEGLSHLTWRTADGLIFTRDNYQDLLYCDYRTGSITDIILPGSSSVAFPSRGPETDVNEHPWLMLDGSYGYSLTDFSTQKDFTALGAFPGINGYSLCYTIEQNSLYVLPGNANILEIYNLEDGKRSGRIFLQDALKQLREYIAAHAVSDEYYSEVPASADEVELFVPSICGITEDAVYFRIDSPIYALKLPGIEQPRYWDAFYFKIGLDGTFTFLEGTYYS